MKPSTVPFGACTVFALVAMLAGCGGRSASNTNAGRSVAPAVPAGTIWGPGDSRAASTVAERVNGEWKLSIRVADTTVNAVEVRGPGPEFELIETIAATPRLQAGVEVRVPRGSVQTGSEVFVVTRYDDAAITVAQVLFG
ncbi:MAG: hypothetical protein KDC95_02230 [Planctomycetes bacterium]|nr:hypothetical protein [Planctomycetota bacterium]